MTAHELAAHTADTSIKETAERPFLVREFRADLQMGDGRTVDVRIVPYGEVIRHADGQGGLAKGEWYEEEFLPGAFNHQLNAASRVTANVEHEKGINGKVGHGVVLREMPDGLHGTFRLLDTPAGETTRQLIQAGSLDGVSIEAYRVKDVRTETGRIQRAKVNMTGIAFTAYGAYKNAKILAVREEPQFVDEALLPVEMDPELVKRLRAQGVALPDRYQAHPASTGTPAESGTPDDGTRQTEANQSSEE